MGHLNIFSHLDIEKKIYPFKVYNPVVLVYSQSCATTF